MKKLKTLKMLKIINKKNISYFSKGGVINTITKINNTFNNNNPLIIVSYKNPETQKYEIIKDETNNVYILNNKNKSKNTLQLLAKKQSYYTGQPNIFIKNAIPKITYLVTLTDPDAPNGESKDNQIIKTNKTYTHWVFTQQGTDNTLLSPHTEYVKYAPPTPPRGVHRYVFTLYSIKKRNANNSTTQKVLSILGDLKADSNIRMNYYELIIVPLINLKLIEQHYSMLYKVASSI